MSYATTPYSHPSYIFLDGGSYSSIIMSNAAVMGIDPTGTFYYIAYEGSTWNIEISSVVFIIATVWSNVNSRPPVGGWTEFKDTATFTTLYNTYLA
jgi:hypothetical protein